MPTSMSLKDLMAPGQELQAQAAGQTQAVTDAMTTMSNLQIAQAKQQQMGEQLEQMKWNSAKGLLNNYIKASPAVRKSLKKQMGPRLMQLGADPLILDSLDDQDMAKAYTAAINAYGNDPQAAGTGMAILASVGAFEDNVPGMHQTIQERAQMQATEKLRMATLAAAKEHRGFTQDVATERLDQRNMALHNQNVNKLMGDAQINKRVNQYNNLKNALANIEGGIVPTTESFNELQQSVRSNLGIKGTSVGEERASTYLTGLPMKVAELRQFLSMQPQDVRKYGGTAFLEHVTALARREMGNIQKLADKEVKGHEAGRSPLYTKHPELAGAWQQAIQQKRSAFDLAPEDAQPAGQAPAAAPAPTAAPAVSLEARAAKIKFNVEAARKAGKTDAQIDAYLKSKGL